MKKHKSKSLKFSSRDGLKLHGTLTLPSKRARASMLMVHGITSDRSEWGIFDVLAEQLAEDGVASLRFDFRGHGDSELPSEQISLMGILSDVLSASDELEARLDGEPVEQRFIIGSSFGGGLSYAAAGKLRLHQAFLLAPVFDYFTDVENCAPKWHSQMKKKGHFDYADLHLGRQLLNETFQFNPLAGPEVPTTIFHGTADTDVKFELSRAVAANLGNIELIGVAGAGHVLSVPGDLDMEDDQSWSYVRFMVDELLRRTGIGAPLPRFPDQNRSE